MKGDFSKLGLLQQDNLTGVLHQQGRVLLDQDWNAAQFIAAHLREALGRDVIGAGVAAVPIEEPDGFRVTRADASASGVQVTLTPGRVWADGLHVELESGAPVVLGATYYGPPVQTAHDTSTINGQRDAVILEVWEDVLSAYQDTANLLESALGGPDTTERTQLNYVLRLYRLGEEEECCCIASRLRTDPNTLGKLTVTPSPVVVIGGDCPVDTGGGYTGLEHYLYRIEIATPDSGHARFKWSRFNGGLVGLGSINPAGDQVTILGNDQMINHCGLTSFYLEALTRPGAHQPWEVRYTAQATLASDGVLSLSQSHGTWPGAAGDKVFIRLWNGIKNIADFTAATELENGIQLQFDAPTASNYRPGDYWTFPVRTAGVNFDPSIWPSHQGPKEGIVYHRAPLAEIHWPAQAPTTATAPDQIHDCRRPLPPLTRLPGCCSYMVGDGISTFGDFNSVEQALDQLPDAGGVLCLLPGTHQANVRLHHRQDVEIRGCGTHTRVIPREGTRQHPIFHVLDSQRIRITGLNAFTLEGIAIMVEGTEPGDVSHIEIDSNNIVAGRNGIVVGNAAEIGIRHNRIRVIDKADAGEAIVLMAEGACIERNDIGVVPAENSVPPGNVPPEQPPPENPCAEPEEIYRRREWVVGYVNYFVYTVWGTPQRPFQALGGIRISGGAERVQVLENTINGGAGDGICLGGSVLLAGTVQEQPPADTPVRLTEAGMTGMVMVDKREANDVVLSIRRSGGREYYMASREDGVFVNNTVPPGEYTMRVESPGYDVKSVHVRPAGRIAPQEIVQVDLQPRETTGREIQGQLITEVVIAGNQIANMGLSGIGTLGPAAGRTRPVITVRQEVSVLSQFGVPVLQIEIRENYIHHCLRNPFDEALLRVVALRGLGGISLGMCDELVICENRIEHNGLSHLDPVTGIFALLVDHLEIRDNILHSNGPYDATATGQLRAGVRGGIVAYALALLDAGESEPGGMVVARDQPAARIYGNVVRQTVGQALTLVAYGPAAIQNNFFSSERSGPRALDLLAGIVQLIEGTGGTVYANNQIRIGNEGTSLFGQFLLCQDVRYHGNQATYLGRGVQMGELVFFVNTVLWAGTVGAGDNRFRERTVSGRSPVLSLVTLSRTMNNTSDNQADHCIYARNSGIIPLVDSPNQVLNSALCPEVSKVFDPIFVKKGTFTERGAQ